MSWSNFFVKTKKLTPCIHIKSKMKGVRKMGKRMVFIMGIGFLLVTVFIPGVLAQEQPFTVGMRIGPFIPQDWQIQGYTAIYYNSEGSPTGATVLGFGNGVDLGFYGSYYSPYNWGLMLEASGRLLLKKKLDMAFTTGKDYYENRLIIFPITLSLTHKISVSNSKITPYLGIGTGVYISEWEQKHYPEGAERTWLKGSSNIIGVHFLTGFNCPLYYDILFDCELRYSYAETDLKIKDVDKNTETELKNLNIGGVSLKLGLGFRF